MDVLTILCSTFLPVGLGFIFGIFFGIYLGVEMSKSDADQIEKEKENNND